jgi:four helix bundle protein
VGVSKIRRFEDAEVWQDARKVTRVIYRLSMKEPFSKDWGLVDQIRRASVSIMANIAEGSERISPKEFVQFLGIASASAAEVRSHLYIAFDLGYLSQDQLTELIQSLESIARQLKALRRSLTASTSTSTSTSTSAS